VNSPTVQCHEHGVKVNPHQWKLYQMGCVGSDFDVGELKVLNVIIKLVSHTIKVAGCCFCITGVIVFLVGRHYQPEPISLPTG